MIQPTEHKLKINLKTGSKQWMNLITYESDDLAIYYEKYLYYKWFCFVLLMLFILITNQATLEKSPVTIENVAFFFCKL